MRAGTAALAKLPKGSSSRSIHSSSIQRYPRANAKRSVGIPAPPLLAKTGQFLDVDENLDETIPYEERMGYGSSSAGHLLLQQQRHMLQYMRLIEHDMPKLVGAYQVFLKPA
jgi:small subunit ribosomal protein S35